jgi:hypothetical protein
MRASLKACVYSIALALGLALTVAPGRTGQAIENSPDGLKAQLEDILKATRDKDENLSRLTSLIRNLQIPDDANWFVTTFGEGAGAKVAAAYKSTWAQYNTNLGYMFYAFKDVKDWTLEVHDVSSKETRQFEKQVLEDAKTPVALYTVTLSAKGKGDAQLPGIYVYVQSAFRVVNWQTFYGLPNVKATRIRVGGNVQAAALVNQVVPIYPAEAKRNSVTGTAVLHAVIDRQGYVGTLEYVTGPKELAPSAMRAVLQWR